MISVPREGPHWSRGEPEGNRVSRGTGIILGEGLKMTCHPGKSSQSNKNIVFERQHEAKRKYQKSDQIEDCWGMMGCLIGETSRRHITRVNTCMIFLQTLFWYRQFWALPNLISGQVGRVINGANGLSQHPPRVKMFVVTLGGDSEKCFAPFITLPIWPAIRFLTTQNRWFQKNVYRKPIHMFTRVISHL